MALLQSSEVQTAINNLPIDDYAGRDLLATIKQSIDNGAVVENTTIGALEIQKIIQNLDYDFQVLHDWTHGELQVLMFQVQSSPSNNIQVPDIQRAIGNLDPDDYAGQAILQDVIVLLNSGIVINGNSSGGIEVSKLISGQEYDFEVLSTWIDSELESVGRSLNVTRIEDFQTVITGNIILLEQKGEEMTSLERDFLNQLSIFNQQVQALGITPDEVALYEAFIGAKMIGQIDTNGNPVSPQIGLALSGLNMTRAQRVFNSVGDNIVGGAIESAYQWMVPSHRPYEPIPNENTGGELQVQAIPSVFLTLIQLNKQLQSGEISQASFNDFQKSSSNFVDDIMNMRRLIASNIFINPNFVTGLQSRGLDNYEDFIGTDYESEGILAKRALDGFHGVNGQEMSLDQLAQIGLEYKFDYSAITEGSIDDILAEMRDGGPSGSPLSNTEKQRLKGILMNLASFNTRNIIDPLQSELEYLQSWEPPMHYDPYIRIGQGITGSGGIISYESYGPYADPREKALMITMHLSVLHGLEKDPEWRTGYIAAALWAIDMIGLVGFEDDGVLIGAALSIISYNMLFTTLWRRGSHARLNLSSLNPRNLISAFRGASAEESEINNSEPLWYEKLSEAERKTYSELVNSHSEVNSLSARDQGKIKDIITLMTISDDLGDTHIHSEFKELGRKLLDNPTFAPWGSAAYANERFWNMRLFQILSRGGITGNGIYQFLFDNNSLRSPRIRGANNNQFLGALNLRNTQAYDRSPIFYSGDNLKLDAWKSMFLERYRTVNSIFDELKNFEKYRPDVADDSELESKKAEIEEMRKQFLQGNVVELDASGDAVRDPTSGKLQFVPSTKTPEGNRPDDFKKFVKDWMQTGNPDFNLEYGEALKADEMRNEEGDIKEPNDYEDNLRKAERYADSIGDTEMKDQINWLRNNKFNNPNESLTRTEFYSRLGDIISGGSHYNKALPIRTLSEFNAEKVKIEGALSRDPSISHALSDIFDSRSVDTQMRERFDWFDGENENTSSRARTLAERLKIYAQIEGNTSLVAEIDAFMSDTETMRSIIDNEGIETHQDFRNYLDSRGKAAFGTAFDIATLPEKTVLEASWGTRRFDWFNEDGTVNTDSTAKQLVDRARIQAQIDGDDDLLSRLDELEANPESIRRLNITRFSEFEGHLNSIGVSDISTLKSTPLATLNTRLEEANNTRFSLDDFLNMGSDNESPGRSQRIWRKLYIEACIQGNEAMKAELENLIRNPASLGRIQTMTGFTRRLNTLASDHALTIDRNMLQIEGYEIYLRRLDTRTVEIGNEGRTTRVILMGGTDTEIAEFQSAYNSEIEKNSGDLPQVLGPDGNPVNSRRLTTSEIFNNMMRSPKWSSILKTTIRQIF